MAQFLFLARGTPGTPHDEIEPLGGAEAAVVRHGFPELLADVLAGKIDPLLVLGLTVTLDGVPRGYAAMDKRRATKVLVEIA